MKYLYIYFLFISFGLSAQYSVKGTISDENNSPVMGVLVSLEKTSYGTLTDIKGHFELKNIKAGKYNLIVKSPDYQEMTTLIEVPLKNDLNKLKLVTKESEFNNVEEFSDFNSPEHNLYSGKIYKSEELENDKFVNKLQDVTGVFNSTEGGGYGDNKLSVRGFDNSNIGATLNGISLNNSFTGNFDWYKWNFLSDFSQSIQLNKGFGTGVLNNNNTAAELKFSSFSDYKSLSAYAKVEVGSDNDLKLGIGANTGMIKNIWGLNFGIVNQSGEGSIDKTPFDVLSFYIGSKLKIGKHNDIDLFVLSSSQNHGRNLYRNNLLTYDYDLAKSTFTDSLQINSSSQSDRGVKFNEGWNEVNESYTGKQYWNGKERERFDADYINRNESYSTQPLYNLLWTCKLTDNSKLFTSLYYTNCTDGYSDVLGSYIPFSSSFGNKIDFNKTITANNSISKSILYNNVSKTADYGAVAKYKKFWSRNISSSLGAEYRKSTGSFFGEVRDLLGGEYYIDRSSEFYTSDFHAKLSDTIDHNYNSIAQKIGAFANTDFFNDDLAFNFQLGWSMQQSDFINYMKKGIDTLNKDGYLYIKTGWYSSIQGKIALQYKVNDAITANGSFGYFYNQPSWNKMFDYKYSGFVKDYTAEKYISYELGAETSLLNKKMVAGLKFFSTTCNDQTQTLTYKDSLYHVLYISPLSQINRGLELEINYKPMEKLKIGLNSTLMDVKYQSSPSGSYVDYISGTKQTINYAYYISSLNVGSAPQFQNRLKLVYSPFKNLNIELNASSYFNYYASWKITDRSTDELDASSKLIQALKLKPYTLLDGGIAYKIAIKEKYNVNIFCNLYNILDTKYVMSAADDDPSKGIIINDIKTGKVTNNHTAERASVFMGLPRTFSLGLRLGFGE